MSAKLFEHKKCLITGAASGIGKALAIAAGQQGAQLFLTDINADGLAAVAEQISASGGQVGHHKALDIADFEAVRAFAGEVHAVSPSMDIVMNVAGVAIWGTIENLEHEHWRKTIDINLMGPIHIMECFIPPMITAGHGGHLVNVSSAAGLFGLPWHAAYSASKFGLRGVSEVLRYDLKRHSIKVSLVCPGGVDTGLVNSIEIMGIDSDNPRMEKLKAHFRKRAVSPQSAARAIIKGMRNGDYLIFTSADIRMGHWFQRKFAYPYEGVMRLLNDRLESVARRDRRVP